MSKITSDGLTRILYSCTHMATVGVKGLRVILKSISLRPKLLEWRARWNILCIRCKSVRTLLGKGGVKPRYTRQSWRWKTL